MGKSRGRVRAEIWAGGGGGQTLSPSTRSRSLPPRPSGQSPWQCWPAAKKAKAPASWLTDRRITEALAHGSRGQEEGTEGQPLTTLTFSSSVFEAAFLASDFDRVV